MLAHLEALHTELSKLSIEQIFTKSYFESEETHARGDESCGGITKDVAAKGEYDCHKEKCCKDGERSDGMVRRDPMDVVEELKKKVEDAMKEAGVML